VGVWNITIVVKDADGFNATHSVILITTTQSEYEETDPTDPLSEPELSTKSPPPHNTQGFDLIAVIATIIATGCTRKSESK